MGGTTNIQTLSHNLPFLSFNSTGWNSTKVDFIRTLLLSHGILVCGIQEHFILKENLYKVDCLDNFEVFSIPAYKNNNLVNSGRPSGGLSLIYHHSLTKYATRLSVPQSRRVQGLKLNMPNANLLIINAYFPNDPRYNNFDDSVLLNTFQDIRHLINLVDDNYTIVLMGDLNTDLSRETLFVHLVKNFLLEHNLVTSWEKFDCDFTFYHERMVRDRTVVSKSTIDHFCVKFEDLNFCVDATPLHVAENTSFHDPILLKFELKNQVLQNHSVLEEKKNNVKPQWHKAKAIQINKYAEDLRGLINNINIDSDVLRCRNVHCSCEVHKLKLTEMCEDVLDSVSTAVHSNIPGSSGKVLDTMPGWSEYIQPFKENSQFWKAVWVSAGRPVDTELHRIMKNCRNKFHLAIRHVKKAEAGIRKDKFLDACLNNKVSDILKEIKSSRNKNTKPPSVIDGFNSGEAISSNFKNIYSTIYNTHNDKDDLQKFILENENNIRQSDVNMLDKITPEMIKNIILNFKNNKNDSMYDWKSNALKLGVDSLVDPICDLLKSLLVHGHIPKIFLMCTLVPIIKDNNASKLSSSNYRLIAITSLLLKLFDHILLELSEPSLKPSIHQYGFQSGISTGLCTWTLTETISYFRNRGTPVFLCLMDLTKAFDLVKLSLLFQKLSTKVAPILLRFLIFSYIHQECAVSWNGVRSASFNISNGVRQGAVLSPTLFNLYIDDLFNVLSKSGYGCKIDDMYFGCLGYADDISLIAPCRNALQLMINICAKFFNEHGIKISTNPDVKKTKTKILVYGIDYEVSPIHLGDKVLPYVKTWIHLGHTLCTDESPTHDMEVKRRELIGKIHSLQQELGAQDPAVMIILVRTYLLHLYGCQLWDIYSNDIVKLWYAWHKLIKQLFNLPFPTHKYISTHIVSGDHVKKSIIKRFIKFSQLISDSINPNIRFLHTAQSKDWRSTYGRNVMNICREAGASNLNDVNIDNIEINPIPSGEEWRIPLLMDLVAEREVSGGILALEEVNFIINLVCCE